MLAVIGKSWLDARGENGIRRLDDPNDFVRVEIESALKQDELVIPVLAPGARMPRPGELPESLRPLATRQAVRLTHERLAADVEGLVKSLQKRLMARIPLERRRALDPAATYSLAESRYKHRCHGQRLKEC